MIRIVAELGYVQFFGLADLSDCRIKFSGEAPHPVAPRPCTNTSNAELVVDIMERRPYDLRFRILADIGRTFLHWKHVR